MKKEFGDEKAPCLLPMSDPAAAELLALAYRATTRTTTNGGPTYAEPNLYLYKRSLVAEVVSVTAKGDLSPPVPSTTRRIWVGGWVWEASWGRSLHGTTDLTAQALRAGGGPRALRTGGRLALVTLMARAHGDVLALRRVLHVRPSLAVLTAIASLLTLFCVSPASSSETPSPQLTRRKLELAPRSSTASTASDSSSVPPTPSTKPNPFGAAAPVDVAARERAIEAKLQAERTAREEKLKAERAERERAREEAIKKRSAAANPFGNAKPVDVAAREKEVEEKLAKEREELAKKLAEGPPSKLAAAPQRLTPPHLAASSATGAQQDDDATTETATTASAAAKRNPSQSLRKEGFSYSSIARDVVASPSSASSSTSSSTAGKPRANGNNGSEEQQQTPAAAVEAVAKALDEAGLEDSSAQATTTTTTA
jgi:hypothetical protein